MRSTFLQLLFTLAGITFLSAQETNENNPQRSHRYGIKRAVGPISLDGDLSEPSWQQAQILGDFWQKFPRDNVKASKQTEVRVTYDDRNLYIAAVCKDTSYYVVQTLKRDSRFFEGDGFGVVIDPVNSHSNGFLFGLSPLNVQSEDLLTPNAFDEVNFSWDNKWFSAVSRHNTEWVVEMAIPFKTLRYKVESGEWGINFFRNDLKSNEVHSWTQIPVNFESYDLGYTGALVWDGAPPKAGTNISLIPYASGSTYTDKQEDPVAKKNELDGGFDAKVGLSPSLNLDLTVNPDFSQIDVDVQQTNLTRFNLKFPERRPFFLENNDLFTNYGTSPARPIFTRAIGLDENAMPIPITYGARLSGNLGNAFRLGLLNLQTASQGDRPAQNYSIFTFNQSVFKRSLIKGYVTNRQTVGDGTNYEGGRYGRNAGLELNYRNLSGTWNPWVSVHLSKKPGETVSMFQNVGVMYKGRKWDAFVDYFGIDTDYTSDIGFFERLENYDAANDTIIRLGYEHLFSRLRYTLRPKTGGKINAHVLNIQYRGDWNPDWSFNEGNSLAGYTAQFSNTGELRMELEHNAVQLLYATKFTSGLPLPPDRYEHTLGRISYTSDARKSLACEGEVQLGGFYNGNLQRYVLGMTYRAQPWGNFSVTAEQNNLKLPEPYSSENFQLINQRTEINFSNKLFWTTFLQYNTQQNNFNVNSRLQWRYLPMSDLFIGYSDNYFSTPFFEHKNRGVVFKVNYWFSL